MAIKQGKYTFRFRRLKSAQRCIEIVHDVIREIVEISEVNKQEEKASMEKKNRQIIRKKVNYLNAAQRRSNSYGWMDKYAAI